MLEHTLEERIECVPAIFVDFDARVLYSYFPEPAGFENYVPDNWIGLYHYFHDNIPRGGKDHISNMKPLDRSVNRSIGAQMRNQIKKYDYGTSFGRFVISEY